MLSGITEDLSALLSDYPAHFTFESVEDGLFEVRDFQTAGVVAFARGTPFATMNSGTLSVAGQRVKVQSQQVKDNRKVVNKLAASLWSDADVAPERKASRKPRA